MRLIIEYSGERREYRLHEGTTVIGRDPSCDIILPDPSLSRRHLECALEGDRLLIRDLKTKNGTFLGTRRIEEARLPPGVALRAGSVSLLFEADEERSDTRAIPPEEPPRTRPAAPLGDLGSRVPASERYEEDEEPTPSVDETPPLPPGAAEEARVVVRDDRWYLRDPVTGAEVEIVPVRRDGAAANAPQAASAGLSATVSAKAEAPAAAPIEAPAQLPARVARRGESLPAQPAAARLPGRRGFRAIWGDRKRRIMFLLVALAAVILLTIVGVELKPENKVPALSRTQYRTRADAALAPFGKAAADAKALAAEGKNDDAAKLVAEAGGAAVHTLLLLQKEPVEGKPKLAQMLIEALEADSAAVKDFSNAWERAQQRWEEVRKSSESTEAAIGLAQARLAWIEGETTDMTTRDDARLALKQGESLKAIKRAADVAKTSPYWKDVEPLMQQATDAILRAASDEAGQRHWDKAAGKLKELAEARPEIADSLTAKINEYDQRERERADVEQATKLADEGKYDEAARLLAPLPSDSPYAQQAALLQEGLKHKQALELALAEYAAGRGESALDILSKAGLAGSPEATKIKAVVSAKAQALEGLKAGHFTEAKAALEGILRLESAKTNAYAKDAKTTLDSLPGLTKAGAQSLVDEADITLEGHEDQKYRKALTQLEEALRLDPANKVAKERLDRLYKEAVRDFNKALQMPRDNPAQLAEALRLLNDVRDRLGTLNDLSDLRSRVTREIDDIERLQAKQAARGNP